MLQATKMCPCCNQPMPITEELEVNLNYNSAVRNGVYVQLEPREAALLQPLARRWPSTAPYDTLYQANWGMLESSSDDWNAILKVRISGMRKKLKPLGVLIKNTYGIGYRLEYV